MAKMISVALLSFLFLGCLSVVNGLNPAIVKGYKFFDSVTGDEIVVKGIDYYPRTNTGPYNINSYDYFSNKHQAIWERDIPYLKGLGVNAVRLYSVDPKQKHNLFMDALDKAGIYALVSVVAACPICAVTRDQAPDCYPVHLKERGQAVINEFAFYSNTLAISTGNEVNLYTPLTKPQWNAPCQKKFLRDMREYVASCPSLRQVPIGLASADVYRGSVAAYYNCQSDPTDPFEYAEWYGLNTYVFCNGKVFHYDQALGFIALVQSFASYNYSIPVMLTEYGCLSPTFPTIDGYQGQRTFEQSRWLVEQPSVRDQFVGGFVFEYSTEYAYASSQSPYPFKTMGYQNFGVGYLSPNDCDDIKVPCNYTPIPCYKNLSNAYINSNASAASVMMKDFHPSPYREGRTACPSWFPSITNYTWKTDKVPFGKCPPAPKVANGDPAKASDPSHSTVTITVIIVVVVLLIVGAVVTFFARKGEKKVDVVNEKTGLVATDDNGEKA